MSLGPAWLASALALAGGTHGSLQTPPQPQKQNTDQLETRGQKRSVWLGGAAHSRHR